MTVRYIATASAVFGSIAAEITDFNSKNIKTNSSNSPPLLFLEEKKGRF